MQLALRGRDFQASAISPLVEMGAYEALWLQKGASFKSLADRFRDNEGALPSDLVEEGIAKEHGLRVLDILRSSGISDFGVRVHGAGEYPKKLRDARHPIELLYYQGWWDLVETRCVAVVGTRNPSKEGVARAERLSRLLVDNEFTVVSGLAKGIDTVAHTTAIERGGRTIAVLGTPLSQTYPKQNECLQKRIGEEFLLISQVPVLKYMQAKNPRVNSYFFPERNVTMSALTEATVIVEAGETSGTLYQAKAAIDQGRKLFILESCFHKENLTWPKKFAGMGAIRVQDFDDIIQNL